VLQGRSHSGAFAPRFIGLASYVRLPDILGFWASEQTCVVRLVDREAVMDKLVYTASNPVQDHLVERVHNWPGGVP
jgi:hypothetical protein